MTKLVRHVAIKIFQATWGTRVSSVERSSEDKVLNLSRPALTTVEETSLPRCEEIPPR